MICKRCGKDVQGGWRYCPNCGSVVASPAKSMFDEIFSKIKDFRREINEVDKGMDKDIEVMDIPDSAWKRPHQKHPTRVKNKGFTIRITRRGSLDPKVDVRTWGDVDKSEIHKHVRHQMDDLGMKERKPIAIKESMPGIAPVGASKQPAAKPAKVTKEPETVIKKLGDRVSVDIEMPDVRSDADVEIIQLESSVEVRARAGDKAYFKIITKPENLSVTEKSFSNGRLHMEFS